MNIMPIRKLFQEIIIQIGLAIVSLIKTTILITISITKGRGSPHLLTKKHKNKEHPHKSMDTDRDKKVEKTIIRSNLKAVRVTIQ
jgi:hypothetical protein